MSDDKALREAIRRSVAHVEPKKDLISHIEQLEAKLAKAVDALGTALDEMVDYADTHPSWSEIWEAREAARTTLAELKGQNDE